MKNEKCFCVTESIISEIPQVLILHFSFASDLQRAGGSGKGS